MGLTMTRLMILMSLLALSGCGKPSCDSMWEEMDAKRVRFFATSHAEADAEAVFGPPTLKGTVDLTSGTAPAWRWDIKAGDTPCGGWWAQFPPAILTVGRETAFPHPAGLP
jgi:hypothetical protein